MENDRVITISTANSRLAKYWQPQEGLWSEFAKRLEHSVRGSETIQEYLKLPRDKQDELKDIGGFVGGAFAENRRMKQNCLGRSICTIDIDHIPEAMLHTALEIMMQLNCVYAAYSTRKHHSKAPRLRLVIPLNRDATADEYEQLIRIVAGVSGLLPFSDPTSFKVNQLMYWPSHCADVTPVYACTTAYIPRV